MTIAHVVGHDGARGEVVGIGQVLHPDLGADAAELAGQVVERLAVLLGRQVAGVRVLEPVLDHPAHGAVDELLVGDLVDVLALDLGVRLAQDGEASDGSAQVIVSRIGVGPGVAASDGTADRRLRRAGRLADRPIAAADREAGHEGRRRRTGGGQRSGWRRWRPASVRRMAEAVMGSVLCMRREGGGAFSPETRAALPQRQPRTARRPRKIGISALARASPRAALPGPSIGRQVGDLEHRIGRESGIGEGVDVGADRPMEERVGGPPPSDFIGTAISPR